MQIIQEIKAKLLETNDIFGKNGFFFEDQYQFIASGVTDRVENLFYFRYVKPGTTKFRVKSENQVDSITADVRFVAQISKKVDKATALQSLLAQIAENVEFTIMYYSDDTDGIYRAEYNKDAVIRDFYLISIDFQVIEQSVLKYNCGCLCKSNC